MLTRNSFIKFLYCYFRAKLQVLCHLLSPNDPLQKPHMQTVCRTCHGQVRLATILSTTSQYSMVTYACITSWIATKIAEWSILVPRSNLTLVGI